MQEKHDFIENDLMIISKPTMDGFLRAENAVDVIALYMFYYSVAKWQDTNQVKATTGFAAQGLRISEKRVRAAKEYLKGLRLVEDIKRVDPGSGQVAAWYIRVKYIWNPAGVHPVDSGSMDGQTTLPFIHPVEKQGTNALNIYKDKCLKDIKEGPFFDFAVYLKNSILKNNAEAKITEKQVKDWAHDARLMVERDGRDLDKMKIVLDWAHITPFWIPNILSMGKFREKYDTLTMQMNGKKAAKPSLLDRERGLKYEITKKPVNV